MELSEQEKRVLLGLVNMPSATDKEIANSIKMKPSNFSRVKKALLKQDIIKKAYLLRPSAMAEFKVITFFWVELFEDMSPKIREWIKGLPNIVVIYSSRRFACGFCYFKDYSESETFRLAVSAELESHAKNTFWKALPTNQISSSGGSARTMEHYFFGKNTALPPMYRPFEKPLKLLSSERRVVIGLAKYPDLTDREIAKKIGMHPSNFAKTKKRVIKKRFVNPVNLFDYTKVPEINTVLFTWTQYKATKDLPQIRKDLKDFYNDYPNVYYIYSSPDFSFKKFLFSSRQDAQQYLDSIQSASGKHFKYFSTRMLDKRELMTYHGFDKVAEHLLKGY